MIVVMPHLLPYFCAFSSIIAKNLSLKSSIGNCKDKNTILSILQRLGVVLLDVPETLRENPQHVVDDKLLIEMGNRPDIVEDGLKRNDYAP